MKKRLIILLALVFLFSLTTGQGLGVSPNAPEIRVITVIRDDLNSLTISEYLETDVEAYLSNGVTMVPLRAIAEKFSYHVEFISEESKIEISDTNGNEIQLFVDSNLVIKNGEMDTISQPPTIKDGRTFVPVRYISEFFGLTVSWKSHYDGLIYAVWLSEVEFLTKEDVVGDDNYEMMEELSDPIRGSRHFKLNENGKTSRGIGIGDGTDKVIAAYGPGHKVYYSDYSPTAIFYFPESNPSEQEPLYMMVFTIEDNRVTEIHFDD